MPAFLPALRTLFAALLLALAVVRPAAATDFTDIWWNPAENGWGVNFIQSDNFIFATFFIYGADQQPTWYSGQMTYNSGNNTWSGGLYRTTGPYYGGTWVQSQVTNNQVGNVTFTPSSSTTGSLQYNVGSINVSKTITRQTLTPIALGGNYAGAFVSIFSNCNSSGNNGSVTIFVNMTVTQTAAGNLQLLFQDPSTQTACAFQGTYSQEGTLFRIPNASYNCGSSFTSTANVTQIKATAQGIEWQWSSPLTSQFPGCIETGYMSAVLQ
jgi:hypothetical protein